MNEESTVAAVDGRRPMVSGFKNNRIDRKRKTNKEKERSVQLSHFCRIIRSSVSKDKSPLFM